MNVNLVIIIVIVLDVNINIIIVIVIIVKRPFKSVHDATVPSNISYRVR